MFNPDGGSTLTGNPHHFFHWRINMGFSRKEVFYWLESTSDEDLQRTLNTSRDMLSLLTDREQMTSLKWLREQIIEEVNARKEAKQP